MRQDYHVLLHNGDAEEAVLGALLVNNENYYRADGLLREELFWGAKNKSLYHCIETLILDEKIADIISVSQYYMAQKEDSLWKPIEIVGVSSKILTDATFLQNVYLLRELQLRRSYWQFGQKLILSGIDMTVSVDELKQQLSEVLSDTDAGIEPVKSLAAVNGTLLQRIDDNREGKNNTSIPTGFKMIDEVSGFQLTDLNVIAAESSIGKTSLAINISVNAAERGIPVMYYSLEMNAMQLASRINASRLNLSSSTLQYKRLSDAQYDEAREVMRTTSKLPILFDDKATSSFEAIDESIHRNARKGKAKMFVIDYLQILCSTGKISNQEQFLGKVTRVLKNTAKKENVCVVLLSQLARDREDPYPTTSRLRGSGQITEASDNVFFIYRPEMVGKTTYKNYPHVRDVTGTAELIWAKGRNAGTRNCLVGFDAMSTKFYDREFSVMPQDNMGNTKAKKDDLAFIPPEKGALPF